MRIVTDYKHAQQIIAEQDKRIAEIDRLTDLIKMSGGLKCPNEDCGDLGYTPEQNGMGDWYQEQCEWCHSVDESVYWRNQQ